MNRTREAARSAGIYLALVAACVIYGALPLTQREAARAAAERAAQTTANWLSAHVGRSHGGNVE